MLYFAPCRLAESGVFASVLGGDRGGGVREKGRAIDRSGEKAIEGGGAAIVLFILQWEEEGKLQKW